MASQRIDMVIGIDVGMSGTAVAYSNLAKARHLDAPVMEFKNWENRDEEGKVPTQLIYDREDIDRGPIAWGFTKQDQPEYPSNHVYAKWFKIDFGHSSPYTIQQHPTRKDLPSADTCYEHFLSRLYSHIEKKLSASELKPMNKTWKDASIEFIFSFPATWDRATVEKLKGLAKKAGFGDHPKHRLTASLSEPEAVAVFSVLEDKIELQNDNTLLVVDAGGGTIDICLSKVKILGENDIRLAELKPNIGEDAGSTYIDSQFQELALEALEILKKAGHELPGGDPLELAWRMMNGEEFQNCKHSCNGLFADDDVFLVGIPGLNGNVSVEEANIMNGELRVKWYAPFVTIYAILGTSYLL
ncbi:hypothetical protein GL218_05875 [Daldinia childiae]|uniref:uncharacterized protein n=1 Tax=Daldinia childiae TaxID=326645 RepID=UPI001447D6AA|nr:uncharacterized protein GL218_05875 [Daldinia childiae]KAF3058515.1 hypothetical protein GL218_05875 [Daldinia childiae]